MATASKPPVKVLVMCGGKGTRMWPISNLGHPKQFEAILGQKSMFRETIDRVLKGFAAPDIYIATSADYARFLQEQAPEIPPANFILEPAMRDNLGAIGLATAVIHHHHPEAVMIILWGADHLVKKETEFIAALKAAAELAANHDYIVHVDTPPAYPSVHNGWIKIGRQIKTIHGRPVYEFVKQVEKPSMALAQKFFKDKSYLIHVGYMATKPALLIKYYRLYAPEAYSILARIEPAISQPDFQSVLAREYPQFPQQSVDYGLFEKLPPRSQWELPTNMGWTDVGTWELLYHGLPQDAQGNVVIGSAQLMETNRSLIISQQSQPVGIIGLNEVIVVQTPAGLLVCALSHAPQVKDLYHQLQSD